MIIYKKDIIKELNNIGINTTACRRTGIFSQSTMKKFKDGDTAVSMEAINTLCLLLECQPRDLIKFIEKENDEKKIKEFKKVIDHHGKP